MVQACSKGIKRSQEYKRASSGMIILKESKLIVQWYFSSKIYLFHLVYVSMNQNLSVLWIHKFGIDSCQRAMWFLLLLSSRLFSCLASECTCVGTLLPWPRRSTISDCLVSTPQSLSQVMKFSLMPRSLYMFLVCFIIPSHHAYVPFLYHMKRKAKKEIIHIP